MSNKADGETRFRVEDDVRFKFGLTKVIGKITEDRGAIGVGGRRLYGIRFQFTPDDEAIYIELPAVDLEMVNETEHEVTSDS
ncbi:MAG: hypothetical protein WD872_12455 [Pirellulaceae bacterium]